ncbi:hypothetical protein Poli38472_011170 [Pythium oligandrum]|uniref:Uncharacterized protein n=1 Tax=Pythium oligandrum TaxID=41045 RepID=A0A8K1CRS7_PYTOL|nr:hypothetical protein Poli38472_011170 [Pythium oligandrum]|eukprot:TMW67550.1 hypothetical protein Poli38472_011170 [Pythium oligandrum]
MNVASVANATYPQTQLVSDATTSDDVYLGTLHLDQGAVINLSSDSEDTLVVQQPNGLNFEIIRKDPMSTSIEILLPGFGIGTVERVASQEKRSRLSPRSETAGSISSLLNTTVPVLRVVASSDRKSTGIIEVVAKDGNEELVKIILDNCPNLRTLELSGVKLPSFRLFTEVHTVHNRHLVELVLSKWKLDNEESLVEFLDMLSDPASIPAKRLEKLVLNDNVDGVLKEESATALTRVTHLNWKLNYLQAYLPSSISSTYENDLEELRGEEYDEEEDDQREVIQSVPLRSKCALVSVFAQRSSEQSYQRPATRILQFASESLDASLAAQLDGGVFGDEFLQLRDALLLIGTLRLSPSMTDQEWVKALREHGVLPRVKQDPLPIGSSIGITFNTLDYEDLERLTRFFFSDDDRDELFEADCAILREQFGSELRCLPSVRLNFSFIPEFRYSVSAKRQEAYLRKAVRLITHVQTMTKHSRRKFPMRPRFELGFIWLSISNFHVTHGIVEQVHALLALDVRVESLSLPTNTRHVPYDEWRQAWAALLFTICGHSKAAIRPRYPIDRLLIGFYHESPHLEEQYQALFSVLAHATSIKEVIFNNLYARERVQTMWRRFLFAFFSKTSTTSVERVNISYYKMLWPEERVDVASVINARYPETQLLAGATSADDIYLGEVCLPYGAQIQLPSGRKITVDERRDIDEDDEDGERRFFTIPLSMEPKCAFLSVVSASNKHQAPLNRDVLGSILAFGAKPSTRRAMICCTSGPHIRSKYVFESEMGADIDAGTIPLYVNVPVTGTLGLGSTTSGPWEQAARYYHGKRNDLLMAMPPSTVTPRIVFVFEYINLSSLTWDDRMCHLFGYDEDDQDIAFHETCGLVQTQFPDDKAHLPSIPIEFAIPSVETLSPGDQIAFIKSLGILIERAHEKTQYAEELYPDRPRFKLEAIHLDVERFHLTPEVVEALQRLMTQIQVRVLAPPSVTTVGDEVIPGWRHAWATLLFSICGHPQATVVPTKPVEVLFLTYYKLTSEMMLLCSKERKSGFSYDHLPAKCEDRFPVVPLPSHRLQCRDVLPVVPPPSTDGLQ